MVTVAEAEAIIQAEVKDFGVEVLPFERALGRVLAEDLRTDRDLPPFNRVAMDGIAIRYAAYAQGVRAFPIAATQAAGEEPIALQDAASCIEIMTGAALPASADTVIRYEDLTIANGTATVLAPEVAQGQNIHQQGKDRKRHDVVAKANQRVTPALVGMAAAVGATELQVKKLPRVVVISTGDELVEVQASPLPYQIRRSNNYMVKAALQKYQLHADLLHIPDEVAATEQHLRECLQQYDVILLSGGISMGKFDYVPQVLETLAVERLFHKVQQRPGKPFWFGKHANGVLVFALPGNPASTFMCLHRYMLPWLDACLGMASPQRHAALTQAVTFKPPLQYFLQVTLTVNEHGQLLATPLEGNGSGDFANLVEAEAFLELPQHKTDFKEGEAYRVWTFR
ncbi:molybdopterin molybdotransferase MoeA [Pontibacter sp. E15-1]|uniref:molybdopterin molybdotransferase MoeA n=1 Tax=Pontibacter sp. E15-1 TaxID=2919918 RepID=UPI001F4F14F9|nr:molybdopterin molybdotransferase MoeA [Pontibacter sp. E15-1]MCJ8165058.1 molybdopterin molybdotransferase MoeA [Pontibacter sp. E15-1]